MNIYDVIKIMKKDMKIMKQEIQNNDKEDNKEKEIKTKQMNQEEVIKIIQDKIMTEENQIQIVTEDGKYYAPNQEDFKYMKKRIKSEEKQYIDNVFDCDDFSSYFRTIMALKFQINTIGKVIDYSSRHSYNLIITKDKNIKLLEPQNDKLIDLNNDKDMYKLEKAVIII